MKKLFETPEVNAFDYSPEDAVMVSEGFAEIDDNLPIGSVTDPADGDDFWS